ncbi:sn-glycerol-3-phosphate ABC transporter ATP-binding protein UgpC [Brooklawnia cerclae]|uniref:Multiple sugar transport system ATP-binding protein n=1 Tax=Brooklawnia cerclae TaxID=349934 RepID=A0ABX0SJE1_9ACTN|nr:ABC transporter ATP-binding protein [Brooklawnia cerclae]NIH56841.1 multiple sugar transport system ATP-binding protein [Brooklawnia cerclae]
MAEIKLTNVGKKYPGKNADYAVQGISYTVLDKQFVSLLGPSGCGKSTTLNMIAGLESVTEGTIEIDGVRVESLEPHKRDLAFVFQDYALYPHLSVYDNIAFGLRMRKMPKKEIDARVKESAEKLELLPLLAKKPRALSGGQRQRVALARAIARRPGVLLFDEPLSNLDALLREKTRSELRILHNDIGATSIYVTHDQEEAMSLSDKIAVMSRGHLEQYGSPDEIYNTPATEFVAGFVGKPRMNLFTAVPAGPGAFTLEGSPFVVDGVSVRSDQPVRIGLRPSECGVRPAGSDDADGTVVVVEPLGSHTDVIVDIAGYHFVVRVTGFADLQVGQPVRVVTAGAVRHVFDATTGLRLNADD